jgi:tetratricopeptide (TPR) repeat protein
MLFLFLFPAIFGIGIIKGRVLIPFVPLFLFAIFELFSWFPAINKHKLHGFRFIRILKTNSQIITGIISTVLVILLIIGFIPGLIKNVKKSDKPNARDICYKAFYERNPSNEELMSLLEWPREFYREKIMYYYEYDIKADVIPEEIIRLIETSDDYYADKKYGLAIKKYEEADQAINDSGLSDKTKQQLKDSFYPRYEESKKLVEAAERHYSKAKFLEYEQMFEEAIEELEAAISIYPDYKEAVEKYEILKELILLE